ncbi:ECF-type sigma factor [Roseisolibacter sp. H3M3-2]|uniref:ECF-type sigma factor n=1 Tax=Roseisolibacter sp. H3M3-2 TaxID=3031323 RepID=UPI0023DB9B5E|nr:ECF-type sigma factor [Roseisolibacter sp. H3M3-2]MDF1506189.1 ECF-type sigma factor [Roseisolibacter sp. H3M3-2]
MTALLAAWERGDRAALDALMPQVYGELRAQAARALRAQPDGHTLQPTALVHEAYVRLAGQAGAGGRNREHFFAVAALVMRAVLVDHARARRRAKRGGDRERVTLGGADGIATPERSVDVLELDEALQRLAARDPARARVVELRYFVGLSLEETARALGISEATVSRHWTAARLWLRRELSAG